LFIARSRRLVLVGFLGIALFAVAGCDSSTPKITSVTAPSTTTSVTTTTAVTTTNAAAAPAVVATGAIPAVSVYSAPDGKTVVQALANPTSNHVPLVLLVKDQVGAYLHVLLPLRPNGSTGWIKRADVTLAQDPYSITVQLAAHRLTLTKSGVAVLVLPIGVGTADTPTPGGQYYIKELLKPPNPNGAYGPYAYGLSGFSNVLTNFDGGDGVIGIHGTNQPNLVGTDVSHGCIRLHNDDVLKLVPILPLGTPVVIQA
jgi:lipoprotein-anchoring transpeptidase ErfK/SrfK